MPRKCPVSPIGRQIFSAGASAMVRLSKWALAPSQRDGSAPAAEVMADEMYRAGRTPESKTASSASASCSISASRTVHLSARSRHKPSRLVVSSENRFSAKLCHRLGSQAAPVLPDPGTSTNGPDPVRPSSVIDCGAP